MSDSYIPDNEPRYILSSLEELAAKKLPHAPTFRKAADEITRLRAELAAANTRMSKLDFERTAAELERDALAARLAPVEDEELVEIATREIFIERRSLAAAIAAIRPHIEAAERERCARIAEGSFYFDIETCFNSTKKEMTAHVAKAIAAAIRSGK